MLTQSDLRQFTGDLVRYRHQLCPALLYTPGVQYLCEQGKAYWLLDAIASYQHDKRINSNEDARHLQFWTLKVNDSKAVLTCDDGNENVLITQDIPYTDFPLDEAKVWVGMNGDGTRTAYIPSEH
jgi:hypothetical protein